MTGFEQFVFDQINTLERDESWESVDVFDRLKNLYKERQREQFESNSEADLRTADELSPYADVRSLSDLDALIREDEPNAFAPVDATPIAPVIEAPKEEIPDGKDNAFLFAIDQFQKTLGEGVQTIGDATGFDGLSKFGAAVVDQQVKDIEAGGYESTYNESFADTVRDGGFFDAVGWVGEAIAENWASTGASFIGGGAGLLVKGGTKVGLKILGKQLSRSQLAAGVTTGAVTSTLGIGEVRSELESKGLYEKDDALFAVGVGTLIGLLDKVAGKAAVTPAVVGAFAESGVVRELGAAALKTSLIKAGTGVGTEALTEGGQELLVIGAGYMEGGEGTYTKTEVFNRIIDAMVVGGAMGGGVSAVSEVASKLNTAGIPKAPVDSGDPVVELGDLDVADAAPAEDVKTDDEIIQEAVQGGNAEAIRLLEAQAALDSEGTDLSADERVALAKERDDLQRAVLKPDDDPVVDDQPAPADPEVDPFADPAAPVEFGTEDGPALATPETALPEKEPVQSDARTSAQVVTEGAVGKNATEEPIAYDKYRAYIAETSAKSESAASKKKGVVAAALDLFPDAENVLDFKGKALDVTKTEIDGLLASYGLEVRTDGLETDVTALHDNAISGFVSIDKQNSSGLLSETIPGRNITYFEGLLALRELGRVSVGGRYAEFDEAHADTVAGFLFTEQARMIAVPAIASKQDLPYLIAPIEFQSDRQNLYENAKLFREEIVEPEAQEPSDQSLSARAGITSGRTQVPLGDKLRKKADVLAERVGLIGDGRTDSAIYKRAAGFIQFDILGARNDDTADISRNNSAERGLTTEETATIIKRYRQTRDLYVKNHTGDKKELSRQFEELTIDLIQGKLRPKLRNEEANVTFDNLIDEGDYVLLTSADDGSVRTVPKDYIAPFVDFLTALSKQQRILVRGVQAERVEVRNQAQIVAARIDAALLNIADQVVDSGGTGSLFYRALGKTSASVKWRKAATTKANSPITGLRDSAISVLAIKAHPKNLSSRDKEVKRLTEVYEKAVANSLTIEDFVEQTGEVFGTTDALDVGVAVSLGAEVGGDALTNVVADIGKNVKLQKTLDKKLDLIETIVENVFYSADTYRAHGDLDNTWVDGMANPKTDKQKADRAAYKQSIVDEKMSKGTDESPVDEGAANAEAEQEINDIVNELIENKRNASGYTGSAVDLSTRPLDALTKKGDRSEAFNNFYGKEVDPLIIMEQTMSRIRETNWNITVNNRLHDMFDGKGLYRDAEHAKENGIDLSTLETVRLKDRDNFHIEREYLADRHIAVSLSQFEPSSRSDLLWLSVMQGFGAEARRMMTVHSIPLGTQNLLSGGSTIVMAGGTSSLVGKNASVTKDVLVAMDGLMRRSEPISDPLILEAAEAMFGSELRSGQLLNDAELSNKATTKIFSKIPVVGNKLAKGFDKISGVGEGVYRYGDRVPKLVAYILIKQNMQKHYGETKTEAEITELAMRHARDVSFDLDQVSPIARKVRERWPLGGGFISYDALVLATTTKNIRNIIELIESDAVVFGHENIPGFRPEVDMTRARREHKAAGMPGYARERTGNMIAGLVYPVFLNAAVATGVTAIAMLPFGEDDDDELLGGITGAALGLGTAGETRKHMRALMPEYYRNSTITLTGVDEGRIRWLDTARMANHGKFFELGNVLFNAPEGQSIGDTTAKAVDLMFGGYYRAGFGEQAFSKLVNNADEFGNRIWDEDGGIVEGAINVAQFMADETLTNSTLYKGLAGGVGALSGERYGRYNGKKSSVYDLALENAGIRVKQFDYAKELQNRGRQESFRLRSDVKQFRSELKSFNKIPTSRIESYVKRVRSEHDKAMGAMLERIDAARYFGMTDDDIKANLKGTIAAKKVKSLLAGIVPPYDIGNMGSSNTKSIRLRKLDEEAKDNFENNFKEAIDIMNSL